MRTEAEIRQEIARLQALAENAYAGGHRFNGSHYSKLANPLKWVLENS